MTNKDVKALSKEVLSKDNEHLVATEAMPGLGHHSMVLFHVVPGLEEWLKRL